MKWLTNLFKKRETEGFTTNDIPNISNKKDEIDLENENHYTNEVETIKQLKRDGNNQEAIKILLKCVTDTENESRKQGKGWGVAPWYYEQLAILYRKQKQFEKEVEILERFEKQEKAPGAKPAKLAERLIVAKGLLKKQA